MWEVIAFISAVLLVLFIFGYIAASLVTFVITTIQSKKDDKYLYTDWEDDTYAIEVWSTSSGMYKYYKFVKKENKAMVCTLDKVLEELDKKILKTQNSIKELESELTDCMKEAKECRRVIQEIKEMKRNGVRKS